MKTRLSVAEIRPLEKLHEDSRTMLCRNPQHHQTQVPEGTILPPSPAAGQCSGFRGLPSLSGRFAGITESMGLVRRPPACCIRRGGSGLTDSLPTCVVTLLQPCPLRIMGSWQRSHRCPAGERTLHCTPA